jgi:hypothetical protein
VRTLRGSRNVCLRETALTLTLTVVGVEKNYKNNYKKNTEIKLMYSTEIKLMYSTLALRAS